MKTDDLFGAALLVLLAAVLGVLAFHPIPDANVQLFTALASGVLGAGVGTWIGYRWGASKSGSRPLDPSQPPPAA